MEHIEFENVNIPVAVAAKALNSDCQTVRYLFNKEWLIGELLINARKVEDTVI